MSAAQKTAILAQVGHFYFGAVGQFYVGANSDRRMLARQVSEPVRLRWVTKGASVMSASGRYSALTGCFEEGNAGVARSPGIADTHGREQAAGSRQRFEPQGVARMKWRKFLAILISTNIPLLLFGMAALGRRVWRTDDFDLVDIFGLLLQILLIGALSVVSVVLWRSTDRSHRDTDTAGDHSVSRHLIKGSEP